MAGLKQTMMDLNPVSLFSFDGETEKENTRFLRSNTILDETGNMTAHLALETDSEVFPCYMTATGLSTVDTYEQRALRFCPNGGQPNARAAGISPFPKAYVIAPGVAAHNFRNKEWTYIIFGKRDYTFDAWTVGADTFSEHEDPIFQQEGVITIGEYRHRYSYSDHIWLHIPQLSNDRIRLPTGIRLFTDKDGDLADMLCIRFKEGRLRVWKNLDEIYNNTFSKDIKHINFDLTPKSVSIGGTDLQQSGVLFSDRCHWPTTLDNVAIYDYEVTDEDVTRIYRRLFAFDDMVLKAKPNVYMPFDDERVPDNRVFRNLGSTNVERLNIKGNTQTVKVKQQGPMALSRAVRFDDGQSLVFDRGIGNWNAWFDPLQDFTFYQNFKLHSEERGCLMNIAFEHPFYSGVSLWCNSKGGSEKAGSFEFISNGNGVIPIASELDQDRWYSVMLVQKDLHLSIYFNGQLVVERRLLTYGFPYNAQSHVATASLLIAPSERKALSASLANTIVFHRAISPGFIRAMNEYELAYYIKGTTSVERIPGKARIRAYNHHTGQFINETWSNADTGAFVLFLRDGSAVDVLVMDDADIRTKVRGYGPIVPYSRPYDNFWP